MVCSGLLGMQKGWGFSPKTCGRRRDEIDRAPWMGGGKQAGEAAAMEGEISTE